MGFNSAFKGVKILEGSFHQQIGCKFKEVTN